MGAVWFWWGLQPTLREEMEICLAGVSAHASPVTTYAPGGDGNTKRQVRDVGVKMVTTYAPGGDGNFGGYNVVIYVKELQPTLREEMEISIVI